jgi:hypothetical protein
MDPRVLRRDVGDTGIGQRVGVRQSDHERRLIAVRRSGSIKDHPSLLAELGDPGGVAILFFQGGLSLTRKN